MGELSSARVWRAATCVLAAAWAVMACGGGGDDDAVLDARPTAAEAPSAAARPLTTASAAPTEPCRPVASARPAPRRDTASIEREFVDELRSDLSVGVATGAGAVNLPDPFEGR